MKLRLTQFGIFLLLCSGLSVNAQIIRTIAGTGTAGASVDGIAATAAAINTNASMVKFDASGNLYFTDGNRVRKTNSMGIISTVAGSTTSLTYGDGGPATAAELGLAYGIAFDAAGNLYISDAADNVVRMVNSTGVISTVVGNSLGTPGFAGDGLAATAAELNAPTGMAFDAAGNLYIADVNNNVVRKVNTSGTISTFAGNYSLGLGYAGDGGHATAALLYSPVDVAFDAAGNLLIADRDNNVIRKVNTLGIISTFAGNSIGGYAGDGLAVSSGSTELFNPRGVAVDGSGNVFISDAVNDVVRKVNAGGIISTVAGNHTMGYTGDGVPATSTNINTPCGITTDAAGDFIFVDQFNFRIREVGPVVFASFSAGSPTTCQDSCVAFTNTSLGATDSITWSSPGITISTPHSNAVSICFTTAGTHTITLTAYKGGTPYTAASVVTVTPTPSPAVTRSGHTLSVPAVYSSYQWLNGITLITGATTNSYTYTAPGTYVVIVDSAGCPGGGLFSTLGVPQGAGSSAGITLVPNPNTGLFTIKGNLSPGADERVTLEVTNMIGNVVYETTIEAQQGNINTQIALDDHLPNGLYLLKLSTGQEINISRFVIER